MDSKCGRTGLATLLAMVLMVIGGPDAAGQAAAPASKTYVVVGTALVQKADGNAARELAIADGKRMAVEQMTAELLDLDILVQQFPMIDTVVYNQADAFIQYYQVLNENRRDNQLRVLVQAKVSGQMIEAKLRSAGIFSSDARPVAQLSLSVVGSDNLNAFVLFRSGLNETAGVESVQISEILPNRTTLAVGYRGTASAFAEALLRQPQVGYTMRVFQESDQAFRIDLGSAQAAPNQD